MIKKHLKRGLSLLLALVLVATTFFIFDPDLLRVESDAYAEVETVEQATPLAAQSLYATETIYLKAGSSAFQYYENYSYNSGKVTSPVDTSGSVFFENKDANAVSLYVNNVYKKGGSQVSAGNLVVNSTAVSAYAGMSYNSTAPASGATKIASSSTGTLSYAITAGSLAGWVENGVYIIEWVVEYTISGTKRYAFAYTGIYAPFLGQAGITYDFQHSGDGDSYNISDDDDARQEAFSFVTGVEAVAGGNAKSNLVSTSNNGYLAPLIGFVGKYNNADSYTVAGGMNTSHLSENGYFTSQAQGGVAATTQMIDRDGGDSEERNGYAVTNDFNTYNKSLDSNGNSDFFKNGVPYVTQHNNLYREQVYTEGWSTGVGYITVDRSRYTNYSQIPNLSVGWLELYQYRGTESNLLSWIHILDQASINFDAESNAGYSIAYDSTNASGGTNDSLTRGLYKINGPILETSGLLQIVFRTKTDRNRTFNDHAIICTSNVGLYTTTWNQNMVRTQYNAALNSIIDSYNINQYYTGSDKSTKYKTYYETLKLVAEELVDPTAHSMAQASNLETITEEVVDSINSSFGSDVVFLVPEVIYTKPLGSNGTVQHHYGGVYVNNIYNTNTQKIEMQTGDNKVGQIYFGYKYATDIKISYTVKSDSQYAVYYADSHNADGFDGGTITLSGDANGASEVVTMRQSTTSVSGATTQATLKNNATKFITSSTVLFCHNIYDADDKYCWLEWTVSYYDSNAGMTKTIKAYTYVYRTFYLPVGGAARNLNTGGDDDYNSIIGFMSGVHSISDTGMTYYSKTTEGRQFIPYALGVQLGTGANLNHSSNLAYGSLFRYPFADTTFEDTNGERGPADYLKDTIDNSAYYPSSVPKNMGWASCDRNQDWLTLRSKGGTGNITVDSSRYTSLNTLTGFGIGLYVTDNEAQNKGNWQICDYTGSDTSIYNGDNYTGESEMKNLYNSVGRGVVAGYSGYQEVSGRNGGGMKWYGKPSVALNSSGTTSYTFKYDMTTMDDGGSDSRSMSTVVTFLNVTTFNKAKLREGVLYAIQKADEIDSAFYNTSHQDWTNYINAYTNAYKVLTKLDGTISTSYDTQAEMDALGTNLKTYVDTLLAKDSDGKWTSGARKTGTLKVYHKYIDFTENADGTGTIAGVYDLNIGDNGTNVETETFYAGDNLYTGYNTAEGYNYFGYYRSEAADDSWIQDDGLRVIKGDMAAQGSYGSTGDNIDKCYAGTSLTYTYIYTKDPSGVYMDLGEADVSFMNKPNLADVSKVEIDTAFTQDDTYYYDFNTTTTKTQTDSAIQFQSEVANVAVTKGKTDGFDFSILQTGYNTYTPKVSGRVNLFDMAASDLSNANNGTVSEVDYDTNSFRLNATGSDAYVGGWDGFNVMQLTRGREYLLTFDYKFNDGLDAGDRLQYFLFTCADENKTYANDAANGYPQISANQGIVPTGATGTYSVRFTVPDTANNKGYVSLRMGTHFSGVYSSQDVTFSNISVYDLEAPSSFAKMNDIFLPNVATGLEGGKTYTVSFKSSLRYDDYRWYAINMYGEATPEMDWAHEQGTIQMFISTTGTGEDGMLTNYTVPVRVTTEVSTGGTIGEFTMPAGCTNINLGFCVTSDTPLSGWVDEIRIVEGDYVEVGAPGETYDIEEPVWVGHTFTGWTEKSTPFHGSLSGDKNAHYTYGTSSDTVLANWVINKYDITFDNEFDFDQGWQYLNTNRGEITVDTDENSFVLKTKADGDGTDNNVLSGSIMDIAPGHRYRVSYDYNVLNYVSGGGIQNHFFFYANETDAKNNAWSNVGFPGYNGCPDYISGSTYPSVANKLQGTVTFEFIAPDTAEFARLRLGNTNQLGMEVEFSDIYVQDITRGSGSNLIHDTTVSEPHMTIDGDTTVVHNLVRNYQETIKNDEISSLPLISSELYDFDAWYTGKNGTGTKVTVDDKTQVGTNQKWSNWTVHLDYLTDSTIKWQDATKKPASQTGIAIGGSATIGTYVPYKVGYNFTGWQDTISGTVYQPGDAITLYQNVNLTPVWDAAPDVNKAQPYQNITQLYPGQIYFYAYTPTANDEYVSGYVFDSEPTLSVALYDGTTVTDGSDENTYGKSADSLVSGALTQNKEYYFGITGDITAKTEVSAKFQVDEHVVNYELDLAGGTDAPTTAVGHYNTATPLTAPKRTGYAFAGWKNEALNKTYDSAVTAGDNSSIILGNTASFTTSQKLVAQWNIQKYDLNVYAYHNAAASPTTVTSTYTLASGELGGTVSIKYTDGEVAGYSATKEITYSDTVTFSAVAKTGYTFVGWFLNPTISNNQITAWGNDVPDYSDTTVTISNMDAADLNVYARFDINTYTVNLVANSNSSDAPDTWIPSTAGGTVELDAGGSTAKYVYGQSFTMTATPATGYDFYGWYYNDNPISGETPYKALSQKIDVTDRLDVNGVITYNARFDVKQYDLHINENGGSVDTKKYSGYVGGKVEVTPPTREGYTFDGWTVEDYTTAGGAAHGSFNGNIFTFGAGDDRAIAKWKVNQYKFIINPVDGEVRVVYSTYNEENTEYFTQSKEIMMDYGSTAKFGQPVKTGYTFNGWIVTGAKNQFNQGLNGNDSSYTVAVEENDVVITADWTVKQCPLTVKVYGDALDSEGTYDANRGGTVKIGENGEAGVDFAVNIAYDSSVTLTATPQAGYSFLGWSTEVPSIANNLKIVSTEATFDTEPMVENGRQYYAVFSINKYDVTVGTEYDTADNPGNYVNDGTTTGGTATGEGTYTYGAAASLKATPAAGYEFRGWVHNGEVVSANETYQPRVTEAAEYVARFGIKQLTVTTWVYSNTAENADDYNNNTDCGEVIDNTTNAVIVSQNYYYGQSTNFTAQAKSGYEFKGWFSDAALAQPVGDNSATLVVPVTDHAHYYAKFDVVMVPVMLYAMSNSGDDINSYTQSTIGNGVSFDTTNYGVTASAQKAFGGQIIAYAKPITGYDFDGWYSAESMSESSSLGVGHRNEAGYYEYTIMVDNASGESLWAKFSVGAYDLNVYAYKNSGLSLNDYEMSNVGGTVSIVQSDAIKGDIVDNNGAQQTAKVYFHKNVTVKAVAGLGYTFAGWYSEYADGKFNNLVSNEAEYVTATMVATGLNYYAKFDVGSFTIFYDANGGSNIDKVTSEVLYYGLGHNISKDANPHDRVGFEFLGWSTVPTATEAQFAPSGFIEAEEYVNTWYLAGEKVTLYAVWASRSNTIYAKSAYSTANGMYYMDYDGSEGGTVEVVPYEGDKDIDENGNVVVPLGAVVQSYLKFVPKAGFAYKGWRYSLNSSDVPEDGAWLRSGLNWCSEGKDTVAMPAQPIYVIGFFEIQRFNAKAFAYYNTATAAGEYYAGATGGTVKKGQTGVNASTAISEEQRFGDEVLFIATPARGYEFSGWYKTPEFGANNEVTVWGEAVVTTPENYVSIKDTSVEGESTANDYYAVFSIKSFKATASVKTYSVSEDRIYSLGENQWPGGAPTNVGGNVSITLTPADDASWLTTSEYENEVSINGVYYGTKVYFEAEANVGYTFGGWYDKQNADYYGENLVEDMLLTYSAIMRESNMYMEAKFVPVTFTLVLDENGGTEGNPSEIVVTYNEPFKITEFSYPTLTGSTFKGWSDSADGAVNSLYDVTIYPETIDFWYGNLDANLSYTIYAVWEKAVINIVLDKQGADGEIEKVEIAVGSKLPDLTTVPEYDGFVFGGYYSGIGGEGQQYYNADGTATEHPWASNSGGTIYALWSCPVLTDIEYDEESDKWTYYYEDADGGNIPVVTDKAITSASEVTQNVNNKENKSLIWWKLKVNDLDTSFVEEQIAETPKINLNKYSDKALNLLLQAVYDTDTEKELGALSQPKANSYVATMAKSMDINFAENQKSETIMPTVKLYENSKKIEDLKYDIITDVENSANGSTYGVPGSVASASYAFAGKWSYTADNGKGGKGTAVDYFLYTNNPQPVVALEIGDGDVATDVASNNSSYPTKATVVDNSSEYSYVTGKSMISAAKATDDLDNAWFTKFTTAGVGTAYDYNAKTVVYLTPEFTSSGPRNEIVYTIKASDSALEVNEGISKATLSGSTADLRTSYESYQYDKAATTGTEDITICICYHNSMNNGSDEGTVDASGTYMQMYMDQVNVDTYINQLHLFRTSGGIQNFEFPTVDDTVYPVEDPTYPFSTVGCTLGSFVYVFDETNEEKATAFAEAGDYTAAKEEIIASVSKNAQAIKAAVNDRSNPLRLSRGGLGVFAVDGWSNNFYPKAESYVYAHLVDRWGNVFNKVWKCYNVDSYPSTIRATESAVYNVFEDGGSNVGEMVLDGANIEFVLDDNSTYENGVYTTTGNTVKLSTGEANKTYSLTVTDKATNTTTMDVTTDGDGMLVFNVDDAKADLSSGAYTFTLNGETVNLYSGVEKLILDADITSVSLAGEETIVTVKTSEKVLKLQLVEGIATRTYSRDAAEVVENEDGTYTWTIRFKATLGEHTYALKTKTSSGWETSDYSLTTEIIRAGETSQVALKSVYNDEVAIGEKAAVKAKVALGTQKVQLVYPDGGTTTYSRSTDRIAEATDTYEIWALPAKAFSSAGEYEINVIAKYDGEWQKNTAKVSVVTVKEMVKDTSPAIYSVEADSSTVKLGEYATFTIVTNSNTAKVRFNYPTSTATFSEANATVVDNAAGTKTWTVKVRLYSVGENDINFSAKSSSGWSDSQSFGTVNVTK